jgi:flagellar protein FlbD
MIRLTRLNHVPLVLNSDLIEHIDVTPDTVITLTNGQIVRVQEDTDEVIRRVVAFRRMIHSIDPLSAPRDAAGSGFSPPGDEVGGGQDPGRRSGS